MMTDLLRANPNIVALPLTVARIANNRPSPTEASRVMTALLTAVIKKELKDQLSPITEELRQMKALLCQPEAGSSYLTADRQLTKPHLGG
jgi:hypothetical protein